MAPIKPSSPYETRSPSSTWAGSPLPSRPATYFTSGAYVRISRSRSPWSPVLRYFNQSVCVSSARLTRQEYGVDRLFPQEQPLPPSKSRGRERPEPPRKRERGDRDDPSFRAAT